MLALEDPNGWQAGDCLYQTPGRQAERLHGFAEAGTTGLQRERTVMKILMDFSRGEMKRRPAALPCYRGLAAKLLALEDVDAWVRGLCDAGQISLGVLCPARECLHGMIFTASARAHDAFRRPIGAVVRRAGFDAGLQRGGKASVRCVRVGGRCLVRTQAIHKRRQSAGTAKAKPIFGISRKAERRERRGRRNWA